MKVGGYTCVLAEHEGGRVHLCTGRTWGTLVYWQDLGDGQGACTLIGAQALKVGRRTGKNQAQASEVGGHTGRSRAQALIKWAGTLAEFGGRAGGLHTDW